jgi:acyl-CoA dehydrogenase
MMDYFLTEDQIAFRDLVRKIAEETVKPVRAKYDREGTFPWDVVKVFADAGFFSVVVPPEYGGMGLGVFELAIMTEELSKVCGGISLSVAASALGTFPILISGNEAQKKKYLVPLLKGKIFCAEALTEPRGGSDFFGATTLAKKKGGYYILNGQKRFVVGADGADIFLVYARTGEDAPHKSISAFIVERDMGGVEAKYIYGLLGTRGGGAGRLVFKDTKVPAENIVLGEGRGADIFNQMMIPERMTSAAGAIGMVRSALEIAAKYSDKRKAFGKIIRDFEGVSFKVADSITKLDAARCLIYATASAVDQFGSTGYTRRLVSESKKFATDTAWGVVNDAMQIMGGIGYTNVYPIERMLRDARLMIIWTGTNEIMDLIIQHEYFREVLKRGDEIRDVEADAQESHAEEEKVYE